MAARLEIGWQPELADAEGEAIRRQAREYFRLEIESVRVLKLLMLDLDLTEPELEGIRGEIFTHPLTQVSSFRPLARDFDGAIWVGYRPGVRDVAGATALEAIAAHLGRPLPPEAAVYTSRLFLFSGRRLTPKKLTRGARELVAHG